jgi:hypothetical protein
MLDGGREGITAVNENPQTPMIPKAWTVLSSVPLNKQRFQRKTTFSMRQSFNCHCCVFFRVSVIKVTSY